MGTEREKERARKKEEREGGGERAGGGAGAGFLGFSSSIRTIVPEPGCCMVLKGSLSGERSEYLEVVIVGRRLSLQQRSKNTATSHLVQNAATMDVSKPPRKLNRET